MSVAKTCLISIFCFVVFVLSGKFSRKSYYHRNLENCLEIWLKCKKYTNKALSSINFSLISHCYYVVETVSVSAKSLLSNRGGKYVVIISCAYRNIRITTTAMVHKIMKDWKWVMLLRKNSVTINNILVIWRCWQ